jgi:hypothetical protein
MASAPCSEIQLEGTRVLAAVVLAHRHHTELVRALA